jgi:hypothetical protein
MTDLIYGGREYKEELKNLFPKSTIEDASDDIHIGRIEIKIPNIKEKEYWRIITLNGYIKMSLTMQGVLIGDRSHEFKKELKKWKKEYPEYFKE